MLLRMDFRTSVRGYTMILERDLLGGYVLWRRWFGLRNRRRGAKMQVFETEEEAMREVSRVAAVRRRHGYVRL